MMKASEIHSSTTEGGVLSEASAREAKTAEATDAANAGDAIHTSKDHELLLEHAYRVDEERVICRLYRVAHPHARYKVEMEGFGIIASSMLGGDRSAARSVYDALVRNTVTPCALEDVLEDWREQHPTVGLWQ